MRSGTIAVTVIVALLAARGAAAQFTTQTVNVPDVDCAALKLAGAEGVPGPAREYQFVGSCKLVHRVNTHGGIISGSGTTTSVISDAFVKASVTWEASTGILKEALAVQSPSYTGKVGMQLRCTNDPIVTTVACTQVAYQNGTGWSGFDLAYIRKRPVTRGLTTLAEATALANKPKPIASAAWPFTLEIESLLGTAQATHGKIGTQPMAGFKKGWWGADAQLFWTAPLVGAQLRLRPVVATAARYEVYLVFTGAPDYAIGQASFDGKPYVNFNGYAPGVSRDRILLGTFDLAAGPHELLIRVAAKDSRSTGFFVGLDQLQFSPK